jgi:dihydrofolate reductase
MQTPPEIIIIVAVSENNIIGKDNALPWKIKEDLQHFKTLTDGWPCIMGRKTYEFLPKKPLPNRTNIIISSNKKCDFKEGHVFSSLTAAINHYSRSNKIFICGGSMLYQEALSIAHRIELTRVHQVVSGDTYFPTLNSKEWEVSNTIGNPEFSFITYLRRNGTGK